MPSLESQLEAARNASQARIPQHTRDIMDAAQRRLAESGLLSGALSRGQRAPDFVLPDAMGRTVSLAQLRASGPVVLSFYRGSWCPYCNFELQAWQAHLPELAARGASLVAISPQKPDVSLSLVEKHSLGFHVLSDLGNDVARRFGIVFTMDAQLRPIYERIGIDLVAHNGDASFELPVPATYLIDSQGSIADAWVDLDYRRRAEPSMVVSRLDLLTKN